MLCLPLIFAVASLTNFANEVVNDRVASCDPRKSLCRFVDYGENAARDQFKANPDFWLKDVDFSTVGKQWYNTSYEELYHRPFDELNRQMRGLGFTGAKGAYELRTTCVDHIYQRYGAEMATSISGDDIKTILARVCVRHLSLPRLI